MDRKIIFNTIYKNRNLIICCAVLIFGCAFGISVLKLLPQNICGNLYSILSKKTNDFESVFLNNFCFPAIIFTSVFLSGFSLLGKFSALFSVFINGVFFSFTNGINYMFLGAENFISSVVLYFTLTVYYGFMLIILTENAIHTSDCLKKCVNYKDEEKPHYKAKNLYVKYIGFTVILAIFSTFSAYISIILQSVL